MHSSKNQNFTPKKGIEILERKNIQFTQISNKYIGFVSIVWLYACDRRSAVEQLDGGESLDPMQNRQSFGSSNSPRSGKNRLGAMSELEGCSQNDKLLTHGCKKNSGVTVPRSSPCHDSQSFVLTGYCIFLSRNTNKGLGYSTLHLST